ncbi:MAG: Ribosomal small subunit methyltransferase [Bacteroidota bacterium]
MKAKKSYGQHFLTSDAISERIAKSLLKTESYKGKVIEVGPGKGMLTKQLLACGYDLLCVEADRDMVAFLNEHYPKTLKDRILSADFMKVKLEEHIGESQFAIIGNYPYNISSQIIFKAIDYREQVVELVGMFQKEMAARVVAPHGSKTYGVISVLTQAYFDCKYLFTVHKGSFNPPPKVESAVIRLTRRDSLDLGCDAKLFKTIVKLSFGQRRKMLRNTMRSLVGMNEELFENPIFNERPEQLSVQQFKDLTNLIAPHRLGIQLIEPEDEDI